MREADQISRNSLSWILISQVVAIAPHGVHMPVWLWVIWLAVVVWRWQIFRGAWNYPHPALKVVLIAICCAGLLIVSRGALGMQVMVSLLLAGFMLKLLEMKKRRDFLMVCYLGYIVVATQFLFFSSLFAAVYGLFSLALMTASLLSANQSVNQQHFFRSFRQGGVLMLHAVPLMLLLFVIMPRLEPLWSVPSNTAAAITGMSDSMSPGDISQLMSSNELAFRATFSNAVPNVAQLYWRGLVFSDFDGRRWSQAASQLSRSNLRWSPDTASEWLAQAEFSGPDIHYEIISEPTNQPWLFTLAAQRHWDSGIGLTQELRLQNREAISRRMRYRVTSVLDYRYQADALTEWQRRQDLRLPAAGNSETRRVAQAWRAETDSAEAYIQRVLSFYGEHFTYTLQPDLLGDDTIDEFLWGSRAGFCEHFAGSFVFFMRAAGIPARVIVGYQGGEFNRQENYWLIRQRDAHAWTEVWLEGKGWVRVDPTAAVAPDRIERGIDHSLNEADRRLLGNPYARGSAWINRLNMRWDAVNYHWSRWVLNYDSERQQNLLSRWLGGFDPWRIALFTLGAGGIILLSLTLGLMLQRRDYRYPADYHYLRFSRKLERAGLPRNVGESPQTFARRVIAARPELADRINHITRLYELANYADKPAAIRELGRAVTAFSAGRRA